MRPRAAPKFPQRGVDRVVLVSVMARAASRVGATTSCAFPCDIGCVNSAVLTGICLRAIRNGGSRRAGDCRDIATRPCLSQRSRDESATCPGPAPPAGAFAWCAFSALSATCPPRVRTRSTLATVLPFPVRDPRRDERPTNPPTIWTAHLSSIRVSPRSTGHRNERTPIEQSCGRRRSVQRLPRSAMHCAPRGRLPRRVDGAVAKCSRPVT
jgi:hypothetical protein